MAEDNIGGFLGAIEELKKKLGSGGLIDAFDELSTQITTINGKFLESRTRVLELSVAVSDSAAGIARLGGDLEKVGETIADIAEGSRRNVVENYQTIQEIYAASQLIGRDSQFITERFNQVGQQIDTIGESVAESILYVQSIGGNAREIFTDVLMDMTLMNRFNFADGVVGLTKMAAQASMLRFDMSNTKALADKVIDPEGAIEVASAMQRLGVTAGRLVDPFALMNDAINDPGGLQDSVIKLAQSYVQFDEKTKRFEINPYGIRMLREIAPALQTTTEELSKAAIASADLGNRLSEINMNITGSEEDKMLVANLAKRDKQGDISVSIRDEKGGEQMVKLRDVTQEQFDKLVKQSETNALTVEQMQREQLSLDKLMQADTAASAEYLRMIAVGQTGFRRGAEDIRGVYEDVTRAVRGSVPSTEEMRKMFEGVGDNIKSLVRNAITETDPIKKERAIGKALDELANVTDKSGKASAEMLKNMLSRLGTDMPKAPLSSIGTSYQNLTDSIRELTGVVKKGSQTDVSGNVNVGGEVNINVSTPLGVEKAQIESIFRDREFQNKLHEIIRDRMSEEIKKR